MKTDFTFFWGGEFSQWYYSKFIVDGVTYNCCEQYMMGQKALMFNDQETFEKIMKISNPKEQKALGRLVKNFNKEIWESKCKDIVYDGNYAKFTQNQRLYNVLLATKGTELVEASVEDKIWGIGLSETDPKAWDKSTWQGTNWLGEILTKLRDDLLNQPKMF